MTNDLRAMMDKYEQELRRLKQSAVPVAAAPAMPATESTAPFQVRVTAANEAIPIADALVVIRRETEAEPQPVKTLLTGISGLTDVVTLPATDPAQTLQPNANQNPITYEVQVSAAGYYRVKNTGVPLYGGIKTVLPVSMIPLPEFEGQDDGELEFSTPKMPL